MRLLYCVFVFLGPTLADLENGRAADKSERPGGARQMRRDSCGGRKALARRIYHSFKNQRLIKTLAGLPFY